MAVQPTLFGEWALVRNWGRIGANGTQRSDWFDTEAEAIQAFEDMKKQKRKRGYC
jgi:predicted DNA-binding WGR domain protein